MRNSFVIKFFQLFSPNIERQSKRQINKYFVFTLKWRIIWKCVLGTKFNYIIILPYVIANVTEAWISDPIILALVATLLIWWLFCSKTNHVAWLNYARALRSFSGLSEQSYPRSGNEFFPRIKINNFCIHLFENWFSVWT